MTPRKIQLLQQTPPRRRSPDPPARRSPPRARRSKSGASPSGPSTGTLSTVFQVSGRLSRNATGPVPVAAPPAASGHRAPVVHRAEHHHRNPPAPARRTSSLRASDSASGGAPARTPTSPAGPRARDPALDDVIPGDQAAEYRERRQQSLRRSRSTGPSKYPGYKPDLIVDQRQQQNPDGDAEVLLDPDPGRKPVPRACAAPRGRAREPTPAPQRRRRKWSTAPMRAGTRADRESVPLAAVLMHLSSRSNCASANAANRGFCPRYRRHNRRGSVASRNSHSRPAALHPARSLRLRPAKKSNAAPTPSITASTRPRCACIQRSCLGVLKPTNRMRTPAAGDDVRGAASPPQRVGARNGGASA